MYKIKLFILSVFLFLCSHGLYAYERVIPMAPNLVETVYALKQGSKVCGVPMFTSYPEEACSKTIVGSYLSPSFETILKLSPDLIIIQGKFEKLTKFTNLYKIPILTVNMDSLDSIYSGILKIGNALDCNNNANELVNNLKKEIDGSLNLKIRPKVFICIGRIPQTLKQLYTCGNNSFISELIYLSGGINIFSDSDKNYLTISKEEITKRNPDIIIDVLPQEKLTNAKELEITKMWQGLFTDGNKKVFILNEDYILIPGPRIGKTSVIFRDIFQRASIEQ